MNNLPKIFINQEKYLGYFAGEVIRLVRTNGYVHYDVHANTAKWHIGMNFKNSAQPDE